MVEADPAMIDPLRFRLYRRSGSQGSPDAALIAHGCQFGNVTVTLRHLDDSTSTAIYIGGIQTALADLGPGTTVEWLDRVESRPDRDRDADPQIGRSWRLDQP
jgi:hypothetical protein